MNGRARRTRGARLAIGGGALVLGAAVLAATGVIPSPFKFGAIDVVDSGSEEARALGETIEATPSPFDTVPVVESGSDAARAMGEEIRADGRPSHDPFEMPIDIVESGTDKARAAGEMLPLDPAPDPFEAMDARARRDAAFAADSKFPRNPEGDVGEFRFDWRIHQRVDSRDALADIVYHVNSADGSWLVQGANIRHLLPDDQLPGAQFEFLLRKANGDLLACGKQRDLGPACMRLGTDLPAAFAWLADATRLRAFLDSVRTTPQTLGPGPRGRARGVRGRMNVEGTDRYLQVWVAPGASPIATQVPWLGMGAGVLKDDRARLNRPVKRVRFEGGDLDGSDVVVDLVAMQREQATRSTAGMRIVTAFSAPALDEANALGASLSAMQEEARQIQAALDACPDGASGRACRALHRDRMRQLNEDARRRALEFGARHGLPVD